MKCPTCGSETNKITAIYRDGEGKIKDGCKNCNNYNLTSLVNFRLTNDTHGFNIGAGHLDDIKHRKLDKVTGKVYRETHKKIFC